eukprot:scpid52211/ scgid10701/ KAT8 regulatory NSL complex subunit 3; NSL complex protein NSL3; Non-specific lethal 3 homolog
MFKLEEPPAKRACSQPTLGDHSYGINGRRSLIQGHCVRTVRRLLEEVDSDDDEFIDPISVDDDDEPLPYDTEEAKRVMLECQNHVTALKRPHSEDDEEARLRACIKEVSKVESDIIFRVRNILQDEQYSRLVYLNNPKEAVLRRLHTDKSANHIRHALAACQWDKKKTRTIHRILLEHLSAPFLVAYLDVMQVLRSKAPTLVDEMVGADGRSTEAKSLALLLKRPWDPALHFRARKAKLPQSGTTSAPAFVVLPMSLQLAQQSRRWKTWQTHLSGLSGSGGSISKVHLIEVDEIPTGKASGSSSDPSGMLDSTCMTAPMFSRAVIQATRSRVKKLRDSHPHRPIILVGSSISALLACEVAQTEKVACVICLGLPTFGLEGTNEDCKSLEGVRCPVFFVVGAHSRMSSVGAIQRLREGMHKESAILLVNAADDQLCLTNAGKDHFVLTQPLLDKSILDEISFYLEEILPPMPTVSTVRGHAEAGSGDEFEAKPKRKAAPVNRELFALGPGPHTPLVYEDGQPVSNVSRQLLASLPSSARNSPASSRVNSRAGTPDITGTGSQGRTGKRGPKGNRGSKTGQKSKPASPKGSGDSPKTLAKSSPSRKSKPTTMAGSICRSSEQLSSVGSVSMTARPGTDSASGSPAAKRRYAAAAAATGAIPVTCTSSSARSDAHQPIAMVTAAVCTSAGITTATPATHIAAAAASSAVGTAIAASPRKQPHAKPQSIAKVLGGVGRQNHRAQIASNVSKQTYAVGTVAANLASGSSPSIALYALPATAAAAAAA